MRQFATVGAVVLLSTMTAILYELNLGVATPRELAVTLVATLAVFGITTYFAVWTATDLGLPSLLLLSPMSGSTRLRRFVVYGLVLGAVISLGNWALSVAAAGAGLVPWYLDRMSGPFGTVLFAARTAVLEETLYRLFAIPFLISLAMRLRHGWRPGFFFGGFDRNASAHTRLRPSRGMVAGAVIASSIFFAAAHPFNPLPALGFGLVLGVIFLRGGWEAAVSAHFLANYLVFSSLYA